MYCYSKILICTFVSLLKYNNIKLSKMTGRHGHWDITFEFDRKCIDRTGMIKRMRLRNFVNRICIACMSTAA